ncbi:MAG: hypothetical protein PF487_13965 [Bacteroidales bacterium]|nr:hypothetical protein [Bacteroidales bacterium]
MKFAMNLSSNDDYDVIFNSLIKEVKDEKDHVKIAKIISKRLGNRFLFLKKTSEKNKKIRVYRVCDDYDGLQDKITIPSCKVSPRC